MTALEVPARLDRSAGQLAPVGVSEDGNDDLTVAAFVLDFSGVGDRCLIERDCGVDEGLEKAAVDKPGYFDELLLVGFDDEVVVLDAWISAVLSVGGNGDHAAAGFEDGPGKIARFAAYGIEDQVDVADGVLKMSGFVIDDFVGTQAFDERDIRG